MDVSRIEAISPKQIDWRRLTAKEIIKYDQQGMDVPMQYLQWAQEFINSIYSDDKTTYQMASSQTKSATSTSQTVTDSETQIDTEESNSDDSQKTVAQQKREDMQNDGNSLIKQAIVFIGESKEGNKETQISEALISSIENASINEIEALENYMADLLSKAEEKQNEFKDEITKINNDNSSKVSFAKINQLQQELQKYGSQGQSQIAISEGILTGYDVALNEQTPIIENAKDFGTETVNIGNDLLQKNRRYSIISIFEWIFGKIATRVGSSTVKKAETTQGEQNQAIDENSSNLQSISSFKAEVESKTGVGAQATPKTQKTTDPDNQSNKQTQTENKENEDKTAQNDGTDTTDKATTNIDEILKRKIRKGENVDNPTT